MTDEDDTDTHHRAFGVLNETDECDSEPLSEEQYLTTTAATRPLTHSPTNSHSPKRDALLQQLRLNLLGENAPFSGPFRHSPTRMIYADWTASGRSLRHLEHYLSTQVLTHYGNTHTTASRSGHQSTCFRHEARQLVAESVNAKITGKAALDLVLFTGNGTTSAINKLVLAMGLHLPLPESVDLEQRVRARPVVFVSSYEHHSNLLPWREAAADVVTIRYSPVTGVCLKHLTSMLQRYGNRALKIGSFAAASNVTGILTDVDAVSICMHRAGGIVIFDYATAAPYLKIDMNPVRTSLGEDAALVYKDAIVFSGHKFVGGPGCPGVLVAKKRLLPPPSVAPTASGGGTVFFVTRDSHRYLSNREEREEGGTPGVVGDIRMGLVMHLKQSIGPAWIEQQELETARKVHARLSANPAIHLLGHPHPESVSGAPQGRFLPIVSFLIQPSGTTRCLHYNFVSALLNDLFGVQSRGGCMCAGPYAQLLLGIPSSIDLDVDDSDDSYKELNSHFSSLNGAIENAVLDKHEMFRPGFTRLSLPYFMSEEKIDYIVRAIEFIAAKGALFLSMYRHNHRTGECAHTTRLTKFPERKWLTSFDFIHDDSPEPVASEANEKEIFDGMFAAAEKEAARIQAENVKKLKKKGSGAVVSTGMHNGHENVRWFLTNADFPQSLPTVPDETVSSDLSLRRPLEGPLNPNILLNESLDAKSLMNMLFSSSEHSLQEKSLYAQKRDKKMNSHSVNTTFSGTDDLNEKSEPILAQHPVLLPRYVNPLSMVKSKTKNEIAAPANSSLELMTAANPTPAVPTPSAAVEKHTAQVVSVPESSRVGNKQHLLGGNGVVFRADSHEPAKSTSSTSNNDKAVLEPSVPVSVPMAKKIKIPVPPKKLLKTVGQAISDWNMIEDGDRVVLGLSGGKDSLCMLHLLRHFQRIAPIRFTLACATVDPQTDSFDPSPLIPYVQSLGITYHYLSEPIVAMAKEKMQGDSLCAFCARFKRGLLYSCCRDNNYNKLVLAQHLDDLAESFMMSALHNGQVRTMKANYPIDNADDDIRVIRPLVYTREQSTRDFSLSLQLPVINENCPACFEEPKERARMKKLLSQEEIMIPSLFQNMRRALTPLMHGDTYKVMHKVVEDIEALNASKSNGKVRKQKRSDDSTEQVVKGETNVDETGGAKKRSRPHTAGDEEGEDSSISKVQCTDEYCAPCYELA